MSKSLLFITVISVSLSSCFSIGKIHEAESLDTGENLIQVKLEAILIEEGYTGKFFQSFDLLLARGVSDNYDMGVFVGTSGFFGMYNKYELLDGIRNDISLGFDARSSLNGRTFLYGPTFYYTHTSNKKTQTIINPSITFTNFSNSTELYAFPSITLAKKKVDSPWTLGYTFSYNVSNIRNFSHSVNIGYNFHYRELFKPITD